MEHELDHDDVDLETDVEEVKHDVWLQDSED